MEVNIQNESITTVSEIFPKRGFQRLFGKFYQVYQYKCQIIMLVLKCFDNQCRRMTDNRIQKKGGGGS